MIVYMYCERNVSWGNIYILTYIPFRVVASKKCIVCIYVVFYVPSGPPNAERHKGSRPNITAIQIYSLCDMLRWLKKYSL